MKDGSVVVGRETLDAFRPYIITHQYVFVKTKKQEKCFLVTSLLDNQAVEVGPEPEVHVCLDRGQTVTIRCSQWNNSESILKTNEVTGKEIIRKREAVSVFNCCSNSSARSRPTNRGL